MKTNFIPIPLLLTYSVRLDLGGWVQSTAGETGRGDRTYIGSFVGGREGRGGERGSERERKRGGMQREKEEKGIEVGRVLPLKGTGSCLPCMQV